ncbi:hypothetical protein [Bacillus sp. S10(2024)]|uniref:hypothetical protein n=1 Tax=Bacillus sp. S10(2024) TaxID=3162886 RepID=UPI003D1A47A4
MEEITALMNKLPRNALEKIKNIEIPSFGPRPALASAGYGGGGGLDSLKDAAYQFMKEIEEKVFGKGTGIHFGSYFLLLRVKLRGKRKMLIGYLGRNFLQRGLLELIG